jgi:hypothetical protein
MSKINEPVIKHCKSKPFVTIQWTPDYQRFGFDEIPSELLSVIKRRVFDLEMTVGK